MLRGRTSRRKWLKRQERETIKPGSVGTVRGRNWSTGKGWPSEHQNTKRKD